MQKTLLGILQTKRIARLSASIADLPVTDATEELLTLRIKQTLNKYQSAKNQVGQARSLRKQFNSANSGKPSAEAKAQVARAKFWDYLAGTWMNHLNSLQALRNEVASKLLEMEEAKERATQLLKAKLEPAEDPIMTYTKLLTGSPAKRKAMAREEGVQRVSGRGEISDRDLLAYYCQRELRKLKNKGLNTPEEYTPVVEKMIAELQRDKFIAKGRYHSEVDEQEWLEACRSHPRYKAHMQQLKEDWMMIGGNTGKIDLQEGLHSMCLTLEQICHFSDKHVALACGCAVNDFLDDFYQKNPHFNVPVEYQVDRRTGKTTNVINKGNMSKAVVLSTIPWGEYNNKPTSGSFWTPVILGERLPHRKDVSDDEEYGL